MTTIELPDEGVRAPDPPTPAVSRRGGRTSLRQVSLLPIWAAIIVVFGLLEPDTFLTLQTFRSLASEQAITAIMALALVLPLSAATYDLSIGGVMGLSMVLVAWLQYQHHLNPALAIALTVVAALGVGVVNSLVIVRLKVDSFIATLGMLSILGAGVQWVSGGRNIVQGISPGFTQVGRWQLLSIPVPFFYMLALAGVCWYVMSRRQTGRYLYATGSNAEAARLAGVRTNRLRVVALLVSSAIAALAGILFTARIGAASLGAGEPYLLPAFAAVFLGATQSRSGRVNVPGTIVAVYVLATGVRGLQLVGAPFWIADLFNGVAVIVAVAMSQLSGRARA